MLKKLPFYSKEIKSEPKEFSNVKLLSELPFFDKPVKLKTKHLTTKELLSALPFDKPVKPKSKHLTTKQLLSEKPLYKKSITKPRTKKLTNQELLKVLPFYDDLRVFRKRRAFKNYAETYEVESIYNKIPRDSLFSSKYSINNLLNDLLREKKGFKYILGTRIILNKHINDNETKHSTVYFNSITKTIINQKYYLNESFEEILNLLDI